MTESSDQVRALSQAILSTEAGRRVGWAKAYAAESSKDALSHDVNILRMERDIMRRAASFLYGFFVAYLERRGDGHLARQALSRWTNQVGSALDSAVCRAGREAADALVVADADHAHRRDEKRAEKKNRQRQYAKDFRAARERERLLLMKRYGFPNEAALYNYLAKYDSP